MNNIVLITGATSGIGRATALKFAQEGYDVLVHGNSDNKEVVEEIKKLGRNADMFVADFKNEAEIIKMFDAIKSKYKKIDILVNNAGMVNRKKFDDFTAEDFQNMFMVNVTAVFICSKEAVKLGCKSIVNIGSMRGLASQATTPDYSASKAAVHNLTASLAREFAPSCRVNCVAPGFTKTPLHDSLPQRLDEEAKKTPLQKFAMPEDIAESVYFLASEKSNFTTGSLLVVDGGRRLSN